MEVKHYEKALIFREHGGLEIILGHTGAHGLHYNVTIDHDPGSNTIKVTGDKAQWRCNGIFGLEVEPERVIEKDTEEYKPWFWSKTKKRRTRQGWVELKARTEVSYESNNFTITL